MARAKKRRIWPRVAAGVVFGLAVGALVTFGVVAPPRCEPIPDAIMARVTEGGIERFAPEQCSDGTLRMRPNGFIPLNESGPVPETEDEGPKVDA